MLALLETEPAEHPDTPELPLPPRVDTQAVVLAGMLCGGRRPLLLDASAVTEIEPRALPLLLALLRMKREAGQAAWVRGPSAALRRVFAGTPLETYFSLPESADSFLLCPDRDGDGFLPSER
jgi:anti-anti-sigma regulatory factor